MRRRGGAWAAACLGLAALAACEDPTFAPRETSVTPQARPPASAPVAPSEAVALPRSAESLALEAYYARVQNNNQVRGLMRTDGGGPDTAFTDTILVRNFLAIALEEEYERGAGFRPSRGTAASAIKKWTQPIRMSVEFGPRVPRDQIEGDRQDVANFAARLGRITGHPISMSAQDPNFHVFFLTEGDRKNIAPRIRQIVPDVSPTALRLFQNLPRGIHCLVAAFSTTPGGYDYGTAIVLIRAEHPDLMRLSCIHEELAQGMGLTNDSPRARPSIFNDDDEFALLTTHDEHLLRILYDPRLTPGMRADAALPVVRERAAALTGGPS